MSTVLLSVLIIQPLIRITSSLENVTYTNSTAGVTLASIDEENHQFSADLLQRVKRQLQPSDITYLEIDPYLRNGNKKGDKKKEVNLPVEGLVALKEFVELLSPKTVLPKSIGTVVSISKILELATLMKNNVKSGISKIVKLPSKLMNHAKKFFLKAKKFIFDTVDKVLQSRGKKQRERLKRKPGYKPKPTRKPSTNEYSLHVPFYVLVHKPDEYQPLLLSGKKQQQLKLVMLGSMNDSSKDVLVALNLEDKVNVEEFPLEREKMDNRRTKMCVIRKVKRHKEKCPCITFIVKGRNEKNNKKKNKKKNESQENAK